MLRPLSPRNYKTVLIGKLAGGYPLGLTQSGHMIHSDEEIF